MANLVPKWRHWVDASAVAGLLSVAYWVLLGIIGIAPITQSDLKWWLLGIGGFLSLFTWYALAKANEKNEESNSEIKKLLRTLAAQTAFGPQIVEQNHAIQSQLLRLNTLYEAKAAITGSGEMSLAVSVSASGVTLTPGIGEVVIEGHAPTISVQALNQQIEANETEVLRLLDEADAWVTTAQMAAQQRNAQEAATRTAAAVQMQNIVNSGDTEFPTGENDKPGE